MKHLGKVQLTTLLLLVTSLLISCGRKTEPDSRLNPRTIVPDPIDDGAEPIKRPKRRRQNQGVSVSQLIASPGLSANVNNTISLSLVNSSSQAPVLGNFVFEGSVPSGVSFVGATSGVSNAQVRSTVATSITVVATPSSGTSSNSVARITLTFTEPEAEPVFECRVEGPKRLDSYGRVIEDSSGAIVGQYAFFRVTTTRQYGTVTFEEVGTGVSGEQAYLYGGTNLFVIKFNSAGNRTLEIKARSGGLRPGALCHKEIVVSVAPRPTPTAPTCGISPIESAGPCQAVVWAGYYFNGNACVMGWNSCSQRLPFTTMSQCESALRAGMCPGYIPPPPAPVPTARWIQTNKQSCSSVCSNAGLRSIADSAGNFCASGENRPVSATGISYSYGTWGGSGSSGGQSQGARCYRPGQKKDNDETDFTVGCYCGS